MNVYDMTSLLCSGWLVMITISSTLIYKAKCCVNLTYNKWRRSINLITYYSNSNKQPTTTLRFKQSAIIILRRNRSQPSTLAFKKKKSPDLFLDPIQLYETA